jgi:hypothetical protein
MSGSYRQCVECGKRALDFATRCPGCGVELPDPAPFGEHRTRARDGSRSLKGLTITAAVLAILGATALFERTPARPAPLSAETTKVVTSPTETATVVAVSEAATPRIDTTAVASTAPGAVTVSLVANGWTHVYNRRNAKAGLEAVLTPGDTVTCDSLANGWYRVALYGEVLGYARETALGPTEP